MRQTKPDPATATPEPAETAVEMSVAEFCGLDDPAMRVIDLKVTLVREVKRRRTAAGLTQADLAKRVGVAKPRIAEMESGREGVSLDAIFAAFFALGGTGADLAAVGREVDALAGR